MKPPIFHPGEIALLLDFDGTLVDVAPTPDAVTVTPELQQLLGSLYVATDGAMALITGRSLESLDAVLKLSVEACGSHGAEWRNNISHTPSETSIEHLTFATALLTDFAGRNRLLLEEKKYSITLHFRTAEHLEEMIDQWLENNISHLNELRIISGKCVREIQLAGIHKGVAVEQYMQMDEFSGRIPVFIGDDVTDEDAFIWVNQAGGVSIKVGDGASEAGYRLKDRRAVYQWLQAILTKEREKENA